jgi:TRAP-type C4-dicarboxylate transport system permease small subunit
MTTATRVAQTPVQRILRGLETAVRFISKAALAAAVLLLLSIFVLIVYSVLMRYLAGKPQPWIDEAAGWLLVGSVMLAIPEVQRRGDHIGIDVVTGAVSDRVRRGLTLFGLLMVLGTAAIFTREGAVMVAFSRMLNILSNQIPDIPLWMVQGFVPLGFGIMALVALVQLLLVLLGEKPRDMAEHMKEDI